jgi:hypothetical protein
MHSTGELGHCGVAVVGVPTTGLLHVQGEQVKGRSRRVDARCQVLVAPLDGLQPAVDVGLDLGDRLGDDGECLSEHVGQDSKFALR